MMALIEASKRYKNGGASDSAGASMTGVEVPFIIRAAKFQLNTCMRENLQNSLLLGDAGQRLLAMDGSAVDGGLQEGSGPSPGRPIDDFNCHSVVDPGVGEGQRR